jgi:hypothetical protein
MTCKIAGIEMNHLYEHMVGKVEVVCVIMIVHMKEGGITKGLMSKWIIRSYLHKESFKL